MDRAAQIRRLVWLSTTEFKARKRYAWQVAKALDETYPGISCQLTSLMTGQDAPTASEVPTHPKLRLVGQK